MSTLLNSAPPPPKWEKQAPRTLGKVRNGGLLGVWNQPTESGILDAWVALLQESPAGSHLHGDTAGLWNITELSEMQKQQQQQHTHTHTHTHTIEAFCLAREVGLEFWVLTPIPGNSWRHHLKEAAFAAVLSRKERPATVHGATASLELTALFTEGASWPSPSQLAANSPTVTRHGFKALAHHLRSSFIGSVWLLRKPAQENVVTSLRLKKNLKITEVGLPSQNFNSQTRVTVSSLQLTVQERGGLLPLRILAQQILTNLHPSLPGVLLTLLTSS